MLRIIGDIVVPGAVVRSGELVVDDAGTIGDILPRQISGARADINAVGMLVVPGFIDMHVHGGGGADFMRGTVDAARVAARTHARHGTTSLLATTLTAAAADIDAAIRAACAVSRDRRDDEARISGVHLEGPFICSARRGAQPLAHVRPPDVAEFAHWLEIGGGLIKEITIAPEVEGARDVIALAASSGVVASVGHTDAKAADVASAVGWGARQATHLFNAMRGIHHREPGAAGASLAMPEIVAEVIADGVHVDPLIVRLIVRAKGESGVVLITDAMEGADMPDGNYQLGGFPVIVKAGVASFAGGTLAGSLLTMNRAFYNVMRFAGIDAALASVYASANAARQIGELGRLGTLEPGKAADIAIVDPSTGEVHWTIIGGRVAYRR